MALRKKAAPKPTLKNWRVEASVPAIQHVEADTKENAIKIACATPGGWDVDVSAPIEAEHVVDAEVDEDE